MSNKGKLRSTSLGACLSLLSACGGGTEVMLSNQTGQELEGVSVQFTGGATEPQGIPVRGVAIALNPSGESHLEVVYRSLAGAQTCRVDTYPERDYRAEFHIALHERSCRVTREDVELPGLFGITPSQPAPNNSSKPTPLRGAA